MASTSTLSRRRGAPTSSIETSSSQPFNSQSSSSSSRPTTPGTQSQSQHKVAYDERDMKDETEERLNPRLTLMEEVLLLGLKDKQVHILPLF